MAYTINLTNGDILCTIPDGTVNSTSSVLTLIGKNYSGYGTFLNDNWVHILENSSNDTAPTTPLTGQLWWDTAGNLKVYTGSTFKTLSSITSSNSSPSGSVTGNQWWDTSNQQLNIYNGSSWTLIGPAFTSGQGTSGVEVSTIVDDTSVSHTAVSVYSGNVRVAIISNAAAYTPQSAISGPNGTFANVRPGITLSADSTNITGAKYWGTAENADKLGGSYYANAFALLSGTNFTGNITAPNGLFGSNALVVGVTGDVGQITHTLNNKDLALRANIGGTVANAIVVTGSTGLVSIPGALTTVGILTSSGRLLATQGDDASSTTTGALRVTGGIGATGAIYSASYTTTGNVTAANVTVSGNVNATYIIGDAISALYGDLAERFTADVAYLPGTVLALGGSAEVTLEEDDLSEEVFGVVSTQPGYVMNAQAGNDALHPAIAISGRVPVRVIGRVKKGDRLVSAGNGLARAGAKSELTSFNVIGRALEDKNDTAEGIVNAIVKLNS